MRAKDLTPGKTPGRWTAEELKPQLLPRVWHELVAYVAVRTCDFDAGRRAVNLDQRPDYPLSDCDLDAFFQLTGN
jgi:hypothetical protein